MAMNGPQQRGGAATFGSLNLNPTWPFWVGLPVEELPSPPPSNFDTPPLPVVVDFAVDRAANY